MKASKRTSWSVFFFGLILFLFSLSLSFSFLLYDYMYNYTSLLYYTTACIDGTEGPTYMNLLLLLLLLYLRNI